MGLLRLLTGFQALDSIGQQAGQILQHGQRQRCLIRGGSPRGQRQRADDPHTCPQGQNQCRQTVVAARARADGVLLLNAGRQQGLQFGQGLGLSLGPKPDLVRAGALKPHSDSAPCPARDQGLSQTNLLGHRTRLLQPAGQGLLLTRLLGRQHLRLGMAAQAGHEDADHAAGAQQRHQQQQVLMQLHMESEARWHSKPVEPGHGHGRHHHRRARRQPEAGQRAAQHQQQGLVAQTPGSIKRRHERGKACPDGDGWPVRQAAFQQQGFGHVPAD